jgi:hypothetical protein
MPLKFVTNKVETTEQNATIGAQSTTLSEVPTENKFIPEAVTDYDGPGSSTGFSLGFTDGKTYDLDEILFSIRRDNPDSPLAVQVVKESSQEEMILQLSTQELLVEYSTDNINNIPNFGTLVSARYQLKLLDLEEIESSTAAEGSLVLNETQPKIGVSKADMLKYLLDDSPVQRTKPIVNLDRPLVIWSEGQGDLNIPGDFSEFDNLNNIIEDLQEDLDANDGGDFEIEDLDGGDFIQEYDEEENGGGF